MKTVSVEVYHRVEPGTYYPSARRARQGLAKDSSHWRARRVDVEYNEDFLDQPEIDYLAAYTTPGVFGVVLFAAGGSTRLVGSLPKIVEGDLAIPLHRLLRNRVDGWRRLGAVGYRVKFSPGGPWTDWGRSHAKSAEWPL